MAFKLQILHASDLEGGVDAIEAAPNFAAIESALEQDAANMGVASITLSAGDNVISGPFFNAASDPAVFNPVYEGFYNELFGLIDASVLDNLQANGVTVDTDGNGFYDNGEIDAFLLGADNDGTFTNGVLTATDIYTTDVNGDGFVDFFDELDNFQGRVDIGIINAIGFDASALGNHEFDLGTDTLENFIQRDLEEDNSLSSTGEASILAAQPGHVNFLQEVDFVGVQFPYLSANLDFSNDPEIGNLFTSDILDSTAFDLDLSSVRVDPNDPGATGPNSSQDVIAPSTIITVPTDGVDPANGTEQIGVIGATTPLLEAISSPGQVIVNPSSDAIAELAAIIQAEVGRLEDLGINKIVLVSHLQQFSIESEELAPLLSGVDIIVAGGSDTILADAEDVERGLQPGDEPDADYPVFVTNAGGTQTAVLSTDGEYSYVGRLVIEFDANGNIVPESVDPNVSGAFATTDEGVAALYDGSIAGLPGDPFADGTVAETVQDLVANVTSVVADQDGNIAGQTDVFLNGARSSVRTEETNFGNLTADANLAIAKSVDDSVIVSVKNGGGIRDIIGFTGQLEQDEIDAFIGQIEADGGDPASFGFVDSNGDGIVDSNDTFNLGTLPNEAADKELGDVSQLDNANTLRFNNGLVAVTLTPEQLQEILEHAVAESDTTQTDEPGQFGQVAGVRFSFDPNNQAREFNPETLEQTVAGERIVNAVIETPDGLVDFIVNGELASGIDAAFPDGIRIVTLDFLENGGDSYPYPVFEAADPDFYNAVFLEPTLAGVDGEFTFADEGSEQDALAEFLFDNFNEENAGSAFPFADTPIEEDQRIQNLAVIEEDTILSSNNFTGLQGTADDDDLRGSSDDDIIFGNDGDDEINGRAGNDSLFGGEGEDEIRGGAGNDLIAGGAEDDDLFGNGGDDEIGGGAGDDDIRGGGGDDTLRGNAGDDEIEGNAGDDTIDGGEGNDDLEGNGGNDTIYGGSGNDEIEGNGGDDTLHGGEGDDDLEGDGGDDTIYGGAGNDEIDGDGGDDTISGGAGNDDIEGGAGNDFIMTGTGFDQADGGRGVDTISFEDIAFGVDASLEDESAGYVNGMDAVIEDEIENFENLIGTNLGDTLEGDDGDNEISGLDGDDIFLLTEGDDIVDGGEGTDSIDLSDSEEGVTVDLNEDAIGGTTLISIEGVIGSEFGDTLTGDEADNLLQGNGGDDTFIGNDGDDTLDGGAGIDTADYSGAETGIVANLSTGTAITNGGALVFDTEGTDTAEIVAFDSGSQQFFVAGGDFIDVLNESGALIVSIPVDTSVTSVAVSNGLLAATVPADPETDPGSVLLFNIADIEAGVVPDAVATLEVGPLPDNLTFTPDGTQILVANEGEADNGIDPEGSISVIDLDLSDLGASTVTLLDFNAFDTEQDALIAEGLAIFGQGDGIDVTVSQDVEPEFIAVAPDGSQAFVTLQENNAVAIVDLSGPTPEITDIVPLGLRDLSVEGNGFDIAEDGVADIITVENGFALFQPDAIASFELGGETFFVTANEGDARGFDEVELGDVELDPTVFPNGLADFPADSEGLEISNTLGDTDGDGDIDQLVAFGGRSFSILNAAGEVIFESGDAIETILSEQFPSFFNDERSNDAGPEPENVATGVIGGVPFIFVGLEDSGSVLAFSVGEGDNGIEVAFEGIVTVPIPGGFPLTEDLDDLVSPEGVLFIPASESPTGQDMLIIADETQGTTFGFNLTLNASGTDTLIDIENLIGTDFADSLTGDAGANTLTGLDGDDVINGLGGNDIINAGAGDDLVRGGGGSDTTDGGEGVDTVSFSDIGFDVEASLLDGVATYSPADGVLITDTLINFENLTGSENNDTLEGDGGDNVIEGLNGDDTIFGRGGADTLEGGDGEDLLLGGSGSDTLNGGDGDDRLFGNRGADELDGGDGDDLLSGGFGADTLKGGEGDDTLLGNFGRDTLIGGEGDDTLIGGFGRDTAVFDGSLEDFTVSGNAFFATIAANDGSEVDIAIGVEVLVFDDVDISLV